MSEPAVPRRSISICRHSDMGCAHHIESVGKLPLDKVLPILVTQPGMGSSESPAMVWGISKSSDRQEVVGHLGGIVGVIV